MLHSPFPDALEIRFGIVCCLNTLLLHEDPHRLVQFGHLDLKRELPFGAQGASGRVKQEIGTCLYTPLFTHIPGNKFFQGCGSLPVRPGEVAGVLSVSTRMTTAALERRA